jgi:hypothetical protein
MGAAKSEAAKVGDASVFGHTDHSLRFARRRGGAVGCTHHSEFQRRVEILPGHTHRNAAGRVYFTGRNGTTVVLDAATDEVRILAENHLTETISASPAIVGREIFLRGEKNLYCIAL